MKLNDVHFAAFVGGVFFDPLTSAVSEKEWGQLCESVRPIVRASLNELEVSEQLSAKTTAEGFQFSYAIDGIEHTLSVTRDQLTFDCGRFRFAEGVPRYLPSVVEGILAKIDRDDWTRIGTMLGFPLPVKAPKESSIGARSLVNALLNLDQTLFGRVFAGGDINRVDLTLKGVVDKGIYELNVYNTAPQHLAVTLDVKMFHAHIEGIDKFFATVLQVFVDTCGPFVASLLSAPELDNRIDVEWLKAGRK